MANKERYLHLALTCRRMMMALDRLVRGTPLTNDEQQLFKRLSDAIKPTREEAKHD